jgi:hypothetical protein
VKVRIALISPGGDFSKQKFVSIKFTHPDYFTHTKRRWNRMLVTEFVFCA